MDIVSLITRITVALEKLADAQLLIATGDGPVPADRTRAPLTETALEAPGPPLLQLPPVWRRSTLPPRSPGRSARWRCARRSPQ